MTPAKTDRGSGDRSRPPFVLADTPLPAAPLLLEASAGTGKTYTITGLVLRLLLEEPRKKLSRILVVTFTRAATQELKNRVRRALREALAACEQGRHDDEFLDQLARTHGAAGARVLREALQQVDELAISTIHGFCKKVLDESAFASALPFRTEFVDDEAPLLLAAAEDAVRLEVQTREPAFAALAASCGLLPEALLQPWRLWRRYPDTVVRPAPRPVDEVHVERTAAIAAIGELLARGDVPRAEIAQLDWLKKAEEKGWAGPRLRDGLVDALAQAASSGTPMVEAYAQLGPGGFDGYVGKRGRPPLDHPFFAHCERVRTAGADLVHALRWTLLQCMDARLHEQKVASHRQSYHDLLVDLAAALRDEVRGPRLVASVAARCDVAILDEFQDTDPLQYDVFRTCFQGRALYLVGDPKQSIYGFRGADVHAYLRAAGDVRATYSLGRNHRSHPDLVAAVAHVFSGPSAFAEAGIEHAPVAAACKADECATEGLEGPALQLRCVAPTEGGSKKHDVVERVVIDVGELCERMLRDPAAKLATRAGWRRIRASDLAVLTRSNKEAQLVQDELRSRGVPSAIGKAGDVFDCPEFADLHLLLEALVAPGRTARLRAAWTTPLFGLEVDDLRALDDERDVDALQARLERAEAYRRAWQRHGWLAMFEELLANERVRERLLLRVDGERKLTNYLHLAELLHRAEHQQDLTGEALLAWLLRQRDHRESLERDVVELRLESDADAVQILTAHGSKGLQYEIVFVPFAWTSRQAPKANEPLLAREPGGGHVLEFRSDAESRKESLQSVLHDQLAEDLRLLYVAMTRARRRCYVHVAAHAQTRLSGLGWLLCGPGRGDAPPTPELEQAWRQGTTGAASGGEAAPAAKKSKKPATTPRIDLGPEVWRAAAEDLAASSHGTIAAQVVANEPFAVPVAHEALEARPMARLREAPPHLPDGFTVTSFTSLVRSERAEPVELDAAPAGGSVDEPGAPTAAPAAEAKAPAGVFAFARGPAAGTCLHQLLELADWKAEASAHAALAATVLREHGLDRSAAHAAPIDAVATAADLVARLAHADLAPLPFRLAELDPDDQAPEWQFHARAGRIVPSALADCFRRHADARLRGYADRLAQLSTRAIQGFLTGSIDLLAMHEGRAYVFDWKSNWLGDRVEDYGQDRLLQDVQQSDYVLQYHLYVLAVHRHLRARLGEAYDYDENVGGACYVYLRGLGGEATREATGAPTGVFCDRPPRALVEALDDWLEGRR